MLLVIFANQMDSIYTTLVALLHLHSKPELGVLIFVTKFVFQSIKLPIKLHKKTINLI